VDELDSLTEDTIEIRHIRVSGKYGVPDAERATAQVLEIDVQLTVDLSNAATSDRLEDTVNYSFLHKKIVKVVEEHSFCLLERLAAEICNDLFEDVRIKAARVSVAKPERLAGATPVVTLVRQNPCFLKYKDA